MSAGETRLKVATFDVAVIEVSAKTTWIVLRVGLSDGTQGFGEATRFGAEEAVLAEAALARSFIVDKDHSLPAGALAALRMAHGSDARNAVANAVEQALIDAMARRAGVAVGPYLGGTYRSSVPAYANINRGTLDRSPAGFAERARSIAAEHGYAAIKIAPFDGLDWRRCGARDGGIYSALASSASSPCATRWVPTRC